ncbi:MAG: DUF2961 domain-containing protein [Chloroflexi bacterium]|nr:DUF2961 domain-containing protein [Chloroflexota bacterium]
MTAFKGSPLGELPRIRNVRTRRESSWDRTGGNNDFKRIQPGETITLADIEGSGCINHIWCTHASPEPGYLRRTVLRAWWDGESEPSVESPLGDFFGVGHAQMVDFVSLPLQMSPTGGRGFNCFFPMPFSKRAHLEVTNEGNVELVLYYYVDYELHEGIPDDFGRFHAQWRRESFTEGISDRGMSNPEFEFGGTNIGGAANYVILEAEGQGHYVGCNMSIQNMREGSRFSWPDELSWPLRMEELETRREALMECFNWYGEGDDMIFIDGEEWPPSLHGTGTEDYFNTAYCPAVQYSAPYHGLTIPGGPNWSDKIALYRFHIEDPIHFQKSIRVTIEHGHANRRSDDLASTAYWYQVEPHKPFPALLPVAERLPRD